MNHVFLFQVHKEPALFERILNRLAAPNHYFAINIDQKSREYESLLKTIKKTPNVVMLSSDKISHGGFSFTACIINQMKYCLLHNISFDYFHTCSGQDYPCVSNEVFDSFFTDGKISYMMMDTEEQVLMWRTTKYKNRLEKFNFTDQINGRIAEMIHLNGVIRKVLSPIRRPYPGLEKIWGGWNWFSLTNECMQYLLNYFTVHPEFIQRFRYTTAADELVFSTVLYPRRKELLINTKNSLRYIEWHPLREHHGLPLILDERDYEDIVSSGALFCRKVEGKYSEKLLDLLDLRSEKMPIDEQLLQNPKFP